MMTQNIISTNKNPMGRKAAILILMVVVASIALMGCGEQKKAAEKKQAVKVSAAPGTPEPFSFYDVLGNEYHAEIKPDAPRNQYEKTKFIKKQDKMTYQDKKYKTRLGVDVSYHQGKIDWKKVKAAGYEFVFLRIGYRGYGKAGTLNEDSMFEEYYDGAKKAGLDIGVYFFAQAINETEAKEEADFVLKLLKKRKLKLPIVYDPESILEDEARTDNVTGEQFTKNTVAFCEKIKKSGYKPMVYSNMMWEAFKLDLTKLKKIPVWYADYAAQPQSPYHFSIWQYSDETKVPGVKGNCDVNIQIFK